MEEEKDEIIDPIKKYYKVDAPFENTGYLEIEIEGHKLKHGEFTFNFAKEGEGGRDIGNGQRIFIYVEENIAKEKGIKTEEEYLYMDTVKEEQ